MSLESFFGMDAGEGMSETAFETLRERMKAAAAQIAAIKKEEKKQKKNEDELIKILLAFVKNSQKSGLILVISRALEDNIPASFILAIILLGNEDVQEMAGKFLLPVGQGSESTTSGGSLQQLAASATADQKALVFFGEQNESLPLGVRIELDFWMKGLIYQAEQNPQKFVKSAYKVERVKVEDPDSPYGPPTFEMRKIRKNSPADLMAYVIQDFLSQNRINEDLNKLKKLTGFIYHGIVKRTEEILDNQKLLG